MPTPAASGLVPETAVLKPINHATARTEDDYEIFVLTDASIYHQSNGQPTSLLNAFTDTPLRLEGRLSRAQPSCVVKKPFRPVDVEVRDITKFSYGLDEEGKAVLWALGRAGWFEICPSRAYKDIFRDMVEAVQLQFFLVDIQKSFQKKRKGGGPSAQLVFQEYAENKAYGCRDAAEAEERFAKHRQFFSMNFVQRKENVAWTTTPIGQWLKKQFPNDYDTAKARSEGRSVGAQILDSPENPAPESSKGAAKPKSKAPSKPTEAPKKDDNWWEAAALFAFMQKAVNLGAMHIGHVTMDKVSRLLVKRYEVDDVAIARNILIAHADNLIYMMDHPKRISVQYFASEPIYDDLSAEHSLSAGDIRRALAVQLRPRNDHSLMNSDMDSDSSSSSSEELELETPKRRPRHKKVGTLSVLRPKSSKYFGKGKTVKPGKGKGKAPTAHSSSEESDTDVAIDTLTHPLLFPVLKRKHEPDALDDLALPRKRAISTALDSLPASVSPPSSPDKPASPAPHASPPLKLLPRGSSKPSGAPILPTIVKTPLPSYAANGPGDTWTCDVDGCTQKVYGASTDLGQKLIREHLRDHERGKAREVELVLQEGQGLSLPVNHLLQRIRQVSESKEQLFPPNAGMNGVAMRQPAPVQRAL